ncbi:unnamed protein product [Amoebophrya sp. A120]|nr:unnamed protein product [Amoebophrya sp. A120]|eukprot:GSA120T00016710001.1
MMMGRSSDVAATAGPAAAGEISSNKLVNPDPQHRSSRTRPRTAPSSRQVCRNAQTTASEAKPKKSNLQRLLEEQQIQQHPRPSSASSSASAAVSVVKPSFDAPDAEISCSASSFSSSTTRSCNRGFIPLPKRNNKGHLAIANSASGAAGAGQQPTRTSSSSTSMSTVSSVVPTLAPPCCTPPARPLLATENHQQQGHHSLVKTELTVQQHDEDIAHLNHALDQQLSDARMCLRLDAERAKTESLSAEMRISYDVAVEKVKQTYEGKSQKQKLAFDKKVAGLEVELQAVKDKEKLQSTTTIPLLEAEIDRLRHQFEEEKKAHSHTEERLQQQLCHERSKHQEEKARLENEKKRLQDTNVETYKQDQKIMRRCFEQEYDKKVQLMEGVLVEKFHRLIYDKERQEEVYLQERKQLQCEKDGLETEKAKLLAVVEKLKARSAFLGEDRKSGGTEKGDVTRQLREDNPPQERRPCLKTTADREHMETTGGSCAQDWRLAGGGGEAAANFTQQGEEEDFRRSAEMQLVASSSQDNQNPREVRVISEYSVAAPLEDFSDENRDDVTMGTTTVEVAGNDLLLSRHNENQQAQAEILKSREGLIRKQDHMTPTDHQHERESVELLRKRKYVVFEVAPSSSVDREDEGENSHEKEGGKGLEQRERPEQAFSTLEQEEADLEALCTAAKIQCVTEEELAMREKVRSVIDQKNQVILCLKVELEQKNKDLQRVLAQV